MLSPKTTTSIRSVFVLLVTLVYITASSFNEHLPANRQPPLVREQADDMELLGVFTLDYSRFLSLGGSWDRRLILQFITTATDAGTKYAVAAYLATSQEDHARMESPILLESQSPLGLNLIKDKTYYIGNNYVRMRSIKRYTKSVKDDNNGKTIKYLKFSAVSWRNKNPDHILFLIQAYDESNNLLKTEYTDMVSDGLSTIQEGGVLSNPSPPADPTTN